MTLEQIYKWEKLNGKEEYDKLLKSGLFWEIFPELSGNYEKDKELFNENENYKIIEELKWWLACTEGNSFTAPIKIGLDEKNIELIKRIIYLLNKE